MYPYIRRLLLALLGFLILFQFYRPERNLSNDQNGHLSTIRPIPTEVETILQAACYDCHSNLTHYPWYAQVQPIASWLANHVKEGKKELNFSTFAHLDPQKQQHKWEETIEMVKEGKMPLNSYTWTHANARLSQQQRETLVAWAQQNIEAAGGSAADEPHDQD